MIPTGRTTGIVCVDPGGRIGITSDGGFAIKLTNKTGGTTTKGYIAQASSATDNAFVYIGNDEPDPMGIVFGDDDGNNVAADGECWVTILGKAYIYVTAAAARENVVRSPVAADGASAGQGVAEAVPTSPFATDKHFQEVGHTLEATAGAGLVLCVLHFN